MILGHQTMMTGEKLPLLLLYLRGLLACLAAQAGWPDFGHPSYVL